MLDLAGAQYGHYDPVVPRHQFVGKFDIFRGGESPHSHCRDRIKRFNLDQKDVVGAVCRINLNASRAIECAIIEYERNHPQMHIRNLLNSEHAYFDKAVGRVVADTRRTLVSMLNDLRRQEDTARQDAAKEKAAREELLDKEAARVVDVEAPDSEFDGLSSSSSE